MKENSVVCFDSYVVHVLMRDLVEHDKQPSAFLVYLLLAARAGRKDRLVSISLRGIAEETGLSKSVVQVAVANLVRRQLVGVGAAHCTATRDYRVFQPWRRLRRYSRARPSPSAKARKASP